MAAPERRHEIERAIWSIRNSSARPIVIIVVVNGTRFDRDICDWLQLQPDISYFYRETPSQVKATLFGRSKVATEYFAFLDDDDEYLVGATDRKVAALAAVCDADYVVTNGYRHLLGKDELLYGSLGSVRLNPLRQLMDYSWLNSGNNLFRSTGIGEDCFFDLPKFAEWTWLAFSLCLKNKMPVVVEDPTVRIHDTPKSASKSKPYVLEYISLFRRMLSHDVPIPVEKALKRKLAAAYHDSSVLEMADRRFARAWMLHCRSLTFISGWKYLSYSRHLLLCWTSIGK